MNGLSLHRKIEENTGLLMYDGVTGYTEWHGNFHEMPFNIASLTFHHHDEENNLKHAVLCKWQRGWRGVDYANRHITLTRLTRLHFDPQNGGWVPVKN